MKKKVIIVLFFFLIFLGLAPVVKADMGPKPTISLEINSYSNERIYVELLIKADNKYSEYENAEDRNDSFKNLVHIIKDKSFDGYVSATLNKGGAPYWTKYVNTVSNKQTFKFGYHPPRKFKVLMYDLAKNVVFISDEINVKAFDSIIKIDISMSDPIRSDQLKIYDKDIVVKETFDFKESAISLVIRLVITIIIEMLVLFLFNYRTKKSYLIVLLTNLFTQIALTICLFIAMYFNGSLAYLFALIIGEIIVLAVESVIYVALLKEQGKGKAVLYAFIANFLSLFIPIFFLK